MERVTVVDEPISSFRDARRQLRFRGTARTHVGLVRPGNQDFVYCGNNLIAVADGVGGNVHGEVASEIAIRAIAYLDDRIYQARAADELHVAAGYATTLLSDAIAADGSLRGMATTLTALRLDGGGISALHVGDSRAYRLRAGVLTQLTRDDSFVQDLVDRGALSAAEARKHPARSVVSQALDGRPVRPNVFAEEADAGDRYLVCSDGLSDYVDDDTIASILAQTSSSAQCCDDLVDVALAAGGYDNVSCVVADLESLD